MARRMVLPLALALLTTSVLADGTQALRAAGSPASPAADGTPASHRQNNTDPGGGA